MTDSNYKLFIIMYHYTRDLQHSGYSNIKGLDIALFRKQMEFFKENYNVVRMEQVIEAAKGRGPLPDKAVLLTFDDGYIDNFTFAFPVLEEFGFQGSFLFQERRLLHINCWMLIKFIIYWQVLISKRSWGM